MDTQQSHAFEALTNPENPMKYLCIPLAAVSLSGCGMSEEDFWAQFPNLWCDLAAECVSEYRPDYNGTACLTEYERLWNHAKEDCEYVPSAGQSCIAALKESTTCDTFQSNVQEGCVGVFRDCEYPVVIVDTSDTGDTGG